ncbi:MAG: class I SAM-dependent methyltransferase [Oceanospirillaceae bacterium]|nr:class I SAM-dependent methyltransferase [Oceanospirillaceae bacterium]
MDYGCGTGTASCVLASQVKEIHGIDISSEMIRVAKKKSAVNSAEI